MNNKINENTEAEKIIINNLIDYFRNEHSLLIGFNTAVRMVETIKHIIFSDAHENKGLEVVGKNYITGISEKIIVSIKELKKMLNCNNNFLT